MSSGVGKSNNNDVIVLVKFASCCEVVWEFFGMGVRGVRREDGDGVIIFGGVCEWVIFVGGDGGGWLFDVIGGMCEGDGVGLDLWEGVGGEGVGVGEEVLEGVLRRSGRFVGVCEEYCVPCLYPYFGRAMRGEIGREERIGKGFLECVEGEKGFVEKFWKEGLEGVLREEGVGFEDAGVWKKEMEMVMGVGGGSREKVEVEVLGYLRKRDGGERVGDGT